MGTTFPLRFRFVPESIPECAAKRAAARQRLASEAPHRTAQVSDIPLEKVLSFRSRIISLAPRVRISRLGGGLSIMAGKAMTSAKANRPVTLKHLAARLAADHEMSKRQGEAILGDLVTLITKHLKKGERIRIAGFGILQVRTRAARMGRNPATGEAIKIKASKKVAFRPAKHLKMAV
jgi:DNA-binding protein HU-beta